MKAIVNIVERVRQISPEFETMKGSVARLSQEKLELERRVAEMEASNGPADKRARFGLGNPSPIDDLRTRFNQWTKASGK